MLRLFNVLMWGCPPMKWGGPPMKWGGPPGPRPTPPSAPISEPDQGVRRGRRRPPHVAICLLFSALCLHAEPADWIYTARYVVTMDAHRDLIDNGAIAVRAGRIV